MVDMGEIVNMLMGIFGPFVTKAAIVIIAASVIIFGISTIIQILKNRSGKG